MQLPQTAEYALRAMAYMSRLPKGSSVRSADLSKETDIPLYYLSKVLRKLVVHRLLHSQKGHGGGFAIALPLAEIRFLDILLAVGYQPNPDRCVFGWGGCDPEHPCPLHPAWSAFNDAFWNWATTTTLAQVAESTEDWKAYRKGLAVLD